MIDTNAVIRQFLLDDATILGLVSTRIYCPRAPENAALPNITFSNRGGVANPHIPDLAVVSVQIDCWAEDDDPSVAAIQARQVYRAVYDRLQGVQSTTTTVNGTTYRVLSGREEVAGQDLADVDIIGRFKVLTFFEIQIREE